MKEIDLDSALDQLIEGGEKTAFERFAIERSSCPSPARFYVAFPNGWTPAEAAHIETCPYCEKSQAYIRSLAESPAQVIVLAARFAWNGIRKALEITVDEARHLVSADSPFGGGFQLAHAGGTLGGDDEEPVAYASTREGDELSIVVKGGRVAARFDGGDPPLLRLEAESGAQDAPETREFTWKEAGRGWQADLGEASKFNGLLTVEDLLAFVPQKRDIYPTRTEQCPSFPKFLQSVSTGWTEQEREHVSGCSYCQYRTAKHWLSIPPGPIEIARYLAGQSVDDEAMQIYLTLRDADAGRRLCKSKYVQALASLYRAAGTATRLQDEAVSALEGLASDFARAIPLPAATGTRGLGAEAKPIPEPSQLTPSTVERFAMTTQVGFSSLEDRPLGAPLTIATRDRFITAQASLIGPDNLKIEVTSGIEYSGRDVLVEILPDTAEPVNATVRLEEAANEEARGEAIIKVEKVEEILRRPTLLIALIPLIRPRRE